MLRHAVLAAAAVTLLGAAAAPARLAPGITFTMRSTSHGSADAQVTKVRFLDGVIRFDIEAAADARKAKAGNGVGFVLVDPKAKAMRMVMPEMQQYVEIKFDSTAGVVMQAMAMNSYVTDIDVAGTSLGSGGTVSGLSTRHHRISTSYKAALHGNSELDKLCRVKMVEEFWVADALRDFPDPTESFARAMGGMGQKTQLPKMGEGVGGAGELMRKRAAAQQKLFSGIPVRSKWTTEESCPGAEPKTEGGQNDITDIQKVDLDPADFRVPAGYTKLDMQSLEGMKAGFRNALRGGAKGKAGDAGKDTTSYLDAAKEGAKEAAKDAAKEVGKDAAKEAAKDAAADAIKDAKKKVFGRFKKP